MYKKMRMRIKVKLRKRVRRFLKLQNAVEEFQVERIRLYEVESDDGGSANSQESTKLQCFAERPILPGFIVDALLVRHVGEGNRVVQWHPEIWHKPEEEVVERFSHQES
jgi:hypothetical protein